MKFTRAIVRPPTDNFADGLTSVALGQPDFALAQRQHANYCAALERCGLKLTRLAAEPDFPDATFVEDTAIVTPDFAILTRPGAASRLGEVERVAGPLRRSFARVHALAAPGTLDGGDVCQADRHFFIGLSERTNEEGARQLGALLEQEGFSSSCVDIRGIGGILHLKSGMSYLGERRVVLIDALADHPAFHGYEIVRIAPAENYAANFLNINSNVIVSAGYPKFAASMRAFGNPVIELDMSEFRKMDGALSCLALRF